MEIGLFAPHIARAIITQLDERGVEIINVIFCARNNASEEIVKRSKDGVITINVSRRAVHKLSFSSLGISMSMSFDGIPTEVTFMPEDLLGIMIPIPNTDKYWCYMLNDIDDQLRLLSGATERRCCSTHAAGHGAIEN